MRHSFICDLKYLAELGIPKAVSQIPQILQISQLRNSNCALSKLLPFAKFALRFKIFFLLFAQFVLRFKLNF